MEYSPEPWQGQTCTGIQDATVQYFYFQSKKKTQNKQKNNYKTDTLIGKGLLTAALWLKSRSP